jgi:hypothetical protein
MAASQSDGGEQQRRPVRTAWALVGCALALASCAPRPLLDRAIRARGGPLTSVVRQVEADVHVGFPGVWRWRTAFLVPQYYAATVYTTFGPNHYVFDGATTTAWIGGRRVSAVAAPHDSVRSQARFFAVTLLDVLRLPGVAVAETPANALPPGIAAELTVVFADDGGRYRLGLDARDLVVRADGPVVLDPVGRGRVTAAFTAFARVGRWSLPHRTAWSLDGRPLADERTLRVCPEPPTLDAAAFAEPARLPERPPGEPGGA